MAATEVEQRAAEHRSVAAKLLRTIWERSYIKGTAAELVQQFGYQDLSQEVAAYLDATLTESGLKLNPHLTECQLNSNVKVSRGSLPKVTERSYPGSADRVYQAVLRTIGQSGHSVLSSDAHSRTVSFNTGMSFQSWSGQDLTVTVFPEDGDHAKVVGGGHRAQRGSIFGGGGQLIDLGEKGQILRRFFVDLDAIFPEVPEPTSVAGPQSDSISPAAELERLANLKAAGHLTDEEFQAAKARLLS